MGRDAIYCRYSSSNQDNGVSIETQLEHCHKLSGPKPLEFIDRAISGRTMQREAFRKMLAAAERGEFDRLLIYKWDRFGRNSETHSVLADLEDLGIKVLSATEGDSGFLARGIGLIVGEEYSRALSVRVKDSMRVRFKQNKSFMGGVVPYGYRTVKGPDGLSRLEIDPDESAVVRRVFALYLQESIGAKRIARRLNDEGYKPRNAKAWAWSTINRMFRNPMYKGVVGYGKRSDKLDRRTGKIKRIYNDEFLTNQAESLRLISDADFQVVQERLAKSVFKDYRLPKDVRAFSNRLICGCCGSVMYTRHTSLQRKKVTYFLVCGRRDRFGPSACSNTNRPTEAGLLAWVQDGIRKVLTDRDRVINRAVELAEKQLDTTDGRREALQKERATLELAIARFGRILRDPKLSDAEARGFSSQIGVLEKERDGILATLDQLAGEVSFDKKALIREIKAALGEAEESIVEVAGPAVVNRGINRFCGRMVAQPDGSITRDDPTGTALCRR
jgi:site-specific DNA recombinase